MDDTRSWNVTSLHWETEVVLRSHSEPTFQFHVRILDLAAAHLTGFLAYDMLVMMMPPL